jgi:hypothetical protein
MNKIINIYKPLNLNCKLKSSENQSFIVFHTTVECENKTSRLNWHYFYFIIIIRYTLHNYRSYTIINNIIWVEKEEAEEEAVELVVEESVVEESAVEEDLAVETGIME